MVGSRTLDWIDVLEALYAVEQPRDTWLSAVLRAMAPLLDRGAGVGGVLYRAMKGGPLQLVDIQGLDVAPEWMLAGAAQHTEEPLASFVAEAYRRYQHANSRAYTDPATTVGRLVGAMMQENQIAETYMINGLNPSGFGLAVYGFSRTAFEPPALAAELLPRLASHMATACRLQRRLSRPNADGMSGVAAVLTARGHVEHATGVARSRSARASLSHAVLRRQRAKQRRRSEDSIAAMLDWKGLVDGRWSLIEREETDGKRFIMARENRPESFGPNVLSLRERQVASLAALGRSNKVIAYELGLAHSTVRVLLARAATKLGARSRAQLVTLVSPAGDHRRPARARSLDARGGVRQTRSRID